MTDTPSTVPLAELCTRMRSFVDEVVIPAEPVLANEDNDARTTLAHLRDSAKERGLWALGHPAEVGGGGVPFLDFVYLNEIIGRSEFGQLAVGSVSMQDTLMLREHGTEEQRRRWIPPLVAGEFLPSVGLTEPDAAGSDPTLIETRAELDGDTWVINGHKWFTTGVQDAGYCSVFARTEPDTSPRHERISAIIVPTDTPGFEIVRSIPTMGHNPSDHYEVRLTDVRVPAANLLGKRGKGFAVAQDRLGPGRIFHCMRWLGQAQRAYELMCARANTRFAHGSLLAEKGEVHRYIAESAAQIHAARLMTLDAARAMDAGEDARVRIGLVKFWGARMLHDVVDRAIQIHGALGLTADTPLERMYRQARYARIYDGPDEVHRMSTARRLLRDPGAAPWR
ncbi:MULTISPECIES: acyl-CoA dehydrogenase family protein [unclassified Rhodococcus (in: high G+C Gram-positive bacteria)]|uniref:acyl-CoA dehydrogenase family protein n=1 Tax=unclassified Rhodococcus (in: high G+C Gram-positive bacteria) TaxID=192944 RepID=UPI00163B133D|nr:MULTISPECIES: acyl-CoA dehydrogenase family protein [unclassified Rhodococcus (in: high G+C Gram-positive bacteria)]MBC2643751.1 acyl-CoA dehydrogenase family protein [Rhodococcus sp. 3A]MBC2891508.1 acyl-CoA dehydrogenase family protein [Rhodococcus sp. 4CII]